MSDTKKRTDRDLAVKERKKTKRPKRWKVLLYNDDYTSMEFVVDVLVAIFHLVPAKAFEVMMRVHEEGRGVAGVYPHDIAEEKVLAVHDAAQSVGFPLRAGLEED
jgi:ATP-dependent Clp protease adaptor protein ClpS